MITETPADDLRREVRARLSERTQPDELMVVSHIYDQPARRRSYEIAAATMTESTAGR